MNPFGRHAAAFRRLRRTDPAKNLVERWTFLQEHRPALAAELSFVPLVIAQGWAIGGTARVACSVGLAYRFAHPELVLHAPRLRTAAQTNSLRAATHALARRVAGGKRLLARDRVTLAGERACFRGSFDAPSPQQIARFPCAEILQFERLFGDEAHEPSRPPVLWGSMQQIRGLIGP